MSYKRSFTKTIDVHYSGTVSYPPSQNGGVKSYSGTTRETVHVSVYVDTDPFDRGVEQCNEHVSGLTAGVVAAESAEIISIKENSLKVGNTIIEGFFSNIRMEVSAQIMELTKRAEALLMDLKEKTDRLYAIKGQMETDYRRMTERYATLFGELNRELENRVVALDQPVFDASHQIGSAQSRFLESDLVDVVAVAGKENAMLECQLGAALAKNHARGAIAEANNFLARKQASDFTIQKCTINDSKDGSYFVPACCLIAKNDSDVLDTDVFLSAALPKNLKKAIVNSSEPNRWQAAPQEGMNTITRFFNEQVNQSYPASDSHSMRVRNMMSKLFNDNNL